MPNCIVRRGAYIAPGVVLMPSFVNLGAYVDEGTMVDTWATVGSCAQIGKNVHLSGGVGIGGVLEPLQANPTIIEDNCFIGARSEVVEGVIVGEGSVLSMGVFISRLDQDRRPHHRRGLRRPRAALFGGGARLAPRQAAPDGSPGPSLYCAVIVKRVDAQTRAKTGDQRAVARLDPMDTVAPRSRPIAPPLPSVTPEEGGALAFIESVLGEAGFEVHRPVFSEPGTPDVENLYARYGTGQPYLLFAGHTDVVPPGDASRWRHDPFGGEIDGGELYGRGAVDMKGGIACMMAAALAFIRGQPGFRGLHRLPDHRRRGGAGDQRHRQAPRMGEGRAASASTIAFSASRRTRTGSAT